MDLVKWIKNPNVQQNALELLFPIIGFLFFDWSLLVIILFYLTDQLGVEFTFWARLKFVQKLFLPKIKWLFFIVVIGFILFFTIEIISIGYVFTHEKFDCSILYFWLEFNQFLKQEFLLFLPALLFLNYFKDKMTFYKSNQPYQISPKRLIVFQFITYISRLILIGLMIIVWYSFKPSDIWFVLLIPIFKLVFDVGILPFFKQKFLLQL